MYNRLFSSILDSSVWLESKETRLVWVTLMAAMDVDGFAHFAAVGNLANRAMVTVEEAAAAVAVLEAPDPNSANPDNEGRRIERVPGGWLILNAQNFKEIASWDDNRTKTRLRMAAHREQRRTESLPDQTESNQIKPDQTESNSLVSFDKVLHAETETETNTEEDSSGEAPPPPVAAPKRARRAAPVKPPPETVEEMIVRLSADPTYDGIDVRREFGKCSAWCRANKKSPPGLQRFTNWLNRAERSFATKLRERAAVASVAPTEPVEEQTARPNLGAMTTADLDAYLADLEAKRQ